MRFINRSLLFNAKIYVFLFVIVLIGIILISNEAIIYGLIFIGIAGLAGTLWELALRNKEEKIGELSAQLKTTVTQVATLQEENEELRSRKLNIAEIKDIIDLGLMQVNTNFTRTWNDKFEQGNKSLHFIGALQVKIIARYGIDLKELRIKHNRENNELTVANLNPKFLSFNDFDYEWKIAEVMEYKKPWIGSGNWRTSPELEGLVGQIKEELRMKTHQEVKNGPQELEWVLDPLKKQIASTIQLLAGPNYRTVRITDTYDDSFKALDESSNMQGTGNNDPYPGR